VYLKLRDRASYEFALASAAVVITVAGGTVTWRALRWWRGHQTVAVSEAEAGSSARWPTRLTSAMRRKQPCATPSHRARMHSKSSWRNAAHSCIANGRDELSPLRSEHASNTRDPTTSPIGRRTPRVMVL